MTTHFTGAFRTISVLTAVSVLCAAGCGLFKKKGADEADAADDAAVAEVAVDAAPPPAAAPIAANVDDVARFPDEKPVENVAAAIQRNGTNVREIPAVGKVVATLAKGGTVTQIATRGTAVLVVFTNPTDQRTLMGWVGQEAFTAAPVVDAGIKVLTCTAPEVALQSDGPFCGRTCASDTDCPAGQACKGAANKLVAGKLGDAVTVCTVFSRPAVAATTVDAGRAVAVTPALAATPKCPAGQAFVNQDKACHVTGCKVGSCPAGQPLCVNCPGVGNGFICVSAGQRQLCK